MFDYDDEETVDPALRRVLQVYHELEAVESSLRRALRSARGRAIGKLAEAIATVSSAILAVGQLVVISDPLTYLARVAAAVSLVVLVPYAVDAAIEALEDLGCASEASELEAALRDLKTALKDLQRALP